MSTTPVTEVTMQSPSSELLEVPPFVNEVTLVGLPVEEAEEEPGHKVVAPPKEDGNLLLDNTSTGTDALHENSSIGNGALQENSTGKDELQESLTGNDALLENSSTGTGALHENSSTENKILQENSSGKDAVQDSSTEKDAVKSSSKENNALEDSSKEDELQDNSKETNTMEVSLEGSNAFQNSLTGISIEDSNSLGNDSLQGSSSTGNYIMQDSSSGGKPNLQDNSEINDMQDSSSAGDEKGKEKCSVGNHGVQDSMLTRNNALQDCSSSVKDSAVQDAGKANDDPQSPSNTPCKLLNGSQSKEKHVLCKSKAGLHGKAKMGHIRKCRAGNVDKSQRTGRTRMRRTTCSKQKIAAWRKLKTLTSELEDMNAVTSTSGSRLENKQPFRENKLILVNTLIQNNTFAKQSLELDSLKGKDQKVEVLTGFNCYATMASVFSSVRSYITHKTPLSNFDQFMVFCMRLRLNLSIDHLASIFDAPPAAICHAFSDVLEVMNKRIVDGLLLWPDRDIAKLAVPAFFQEMFGKAPYLIECKHILIEKPGSAFSQKQTYSKNRCHYSMKYFLCLTSQGTVCFLSRGWGGGTSDKYVTENCGFLQKLMPGDIVLSDPNFNRQEVSNIQGEGVQIPAFTKGRHKLLSLDIGKLHTSSVLQEHIEQILGLTRLRYLMMESVMPVSFLRAVGEEHTKLDKLMRVVCALTNLCSLTEL